MSKNKFRDVLLAAIQQCAVADLRPELASTKNRDLAMAIGRVLGRLRVEIETAPAVAASSLGDWTRLAQHIGVIPANRHVDSLTQLYALAAGIGDSMRARRQDPDFYRELADPASTTAIWFRQMTVATRSYVQACEAALPRATAASDSPFADPGVLRAKLGEYLRRRFPELPSNPVRSLKTILGGRSKETSLFELVPNNVLPTRLVLRRDFATQITGTSVFGEFSLLQKLELLGLPVPKPIAAERDAEHLGGAFIIVGEVVDSQRAGEFFPELNDMSSLDPSFASALTRALARLHQLTEFPPGADLGGHHAASDPISMVRNFQDLWDTLEHKAPLSVATELGFAWLLSHPLPSHRLRRLVHGDVGLHNMMAREGKLAALLDWELAHLGDPAEDIGYIRSAILQPLMPWSEFVATYVAEGGDPSACDLQAVNWYSVWTHTRNSIYVGILYDMACKGQRLDLDSMYPAVEYTALLQQYIVRELEIALTHGDAA